MNQNQLDDLIAALNNRAGASHRPPKLESTDPQDFRIWRTNFTLAVEINRWNHARARQEAKAAMEGAAHLYVEHIPLNAAGPNVAPVAALLDEYEAIFVPAADHVKHHQAFHEAKQKDEERLVEWHNRCRLLFKRAYPALNPQQCEQSYELRARFTAGLLNRHIGSELFVINPPTYAQLLHAAQIQESRREQYADIHGGPVSVKREPGVHAIRRGQGSGRRGGATHTAIELRCFLCQEPGHRRAECPQLGKIMKWLQGSQKSSAGRLTVRGSAWIPRDSSGGRGSRRGRGGRGRMGTRSGRGSRDDAVDGRLRRVIHHMLEDDAGEGAEAADSVPVPAEEEESEN